MDYLKLYCLIGVALAIFIELINSINRTEIGKKGIRYVEITGISTLVIAITTTLIFSYKLFEMLMSGEKRIAIILAVSYGIVLIGMLYMSFKALYFASKSDSYSLSSFVLTKIKYEKHRLGIKVTGIRSDSRENWSYTFYGKDKKLIESFKNDNIKSLKVTLYKTSNLIYSLNTLKVEEEEMFGADKKNLQNQVNALEMKVTELKEELAKECLANEEAEKRIETLNKEKEVLLAENDRLEKAEGSAKEERQRFESEVEELKKENDYLAVEKTDLEQDMTTLMREKGVFKEEKDKLEKEMKELKTKFDEQYTKRDAEKDKLIVEKDAAIKNLEDENEGLKNEVEELKTKVYEINENFNEQYKEKLELIQNLEQAKHTIEELKNELVEKENNSGNELRAEEKEKMDALIIEQDKLIKEKDRLIEEKDSIIKKVSDSLKDLEAANAEKEKLINEMSAGQVSVEELDLEKESLLNKIDQLEKLLAAKNEMVEAQLDSKDREIATLRSKLKTESKKKKAPLFSLITITKK